MDWRKHQRVLRNIEAGNLDSALEEAERQTRNAATPVEKVPFMMSAADCLSRKGEFAAALDLLHDARRILGNADRLAEPWIAMAEAAVNVLKGDPEVAVGQYEEIRIKYHDLLNTPEHSDLMNELMGRQAIALVNAGRTDQRAVDLLNELFSKGVPDDEQLMLLYWGVALFRVGNEFEAKSKFLQAAKGDDPELRDRAEVYLKSWGTVQ